MVISGATYIAGNEYIVYRIAGNFRGGVLNFVIIFGVPYL